MQFNELPNKITHMLATPEALQSIGQARPIAWTVPAYPTVELGVVARFRRLGNASELGGKALLEPPLHVARHAHVTRDTAQLARSS